MEHAVVNLEVGLSEDGAGIALGPVEVLLRDLRVGLRTDAGANSERCGGGGGIFLDRSTKIGNFFLLPFAPVYILFSILIFYNLGGGEVILVLFRGVKVGCFFPILGGGTSAPIQNPLIRL